MICDMCKSAADSNKPEWHKHCTGESWCDCQHRIKKLAFVLFLAANIIGLLIYGVVALNHKDGIPEPIRPTPHYSYAAPK
jgi:hypothetical protein